MVNAYGADVRIRFDPAKVLVVDTNTYSPGTQIQPLYDFMLPDFLIRQVACNALDTADPLCDEPAEVGTIWYTFTQVNPTPEKSGSGAIAAHHAPRNWRGPVAARHLLFEDLGPQRCHDPEHGK